MVELYNGFIAALPVLQSAWQTVLGLVIVAAASGWWVGRFMYGQRIDQQRSTIETLQERVKLRDDQLADVKARLDASKPDEASKTIADLTARLKAIEPYGLTKQGAGAMLAVLKRMRGSVCVSQEITAPDAANLVEQVIQLFEEAQWEVIPLVGVFGRDDPPECGITLIRHQKASPSAMQLIRDALNAGRLDFEERDAGPEQEGDRFINVPQISFSYRDRNYVPKARLA